MYAVIQSGGKQYRVTEGLRLKLEKLPAEIGETVVLDKVLLIAADDNIHIGSPLLAKATVKAEVVSQGRHKKIKIVKFRRRKHSQKQMGHRQDYTEVKITGISL